MEEGADAGWSRSRRVSRPLGTAYRTMSPFRRRVLYLSRRSLVLARPGHWAPGFGGRCLRPTMALIAGNWLEVYVRGDISSSRRPETLFSPLRSTSQQVTGPPGPYDELSEAASGNRRAVLGA